MTFCLIAKDLAFYYITETDARRDVPKIFRNHPQKPMHLSMYDTEEYCRNSDCQPLEEFYSYQYVEPKEIVKDIRGWERKEYNGFTIAFKPDSEGDNIRMTEAGQNDDGRTCIAIYGKGILCQIDMEEQILFPGEYLARSYINALRKGSPDTYLAPFREIC